MIPIALRYLFPPGGEMKERRVFMKKRLELRFMTAADTVMTVRINQPKEDLDLTKVKAAAEKIRPVLANHAGLEASSFSKAVIVTTTETEIQ